MAKKSRVDDPVIRVRGALEKLTDAERRLRKIRRIRGIPERPRWRRKWRSHATYVDHDEVDLPQDPKKAKKLVKIAHEYRKLDMFSSAANALEFAHNYDKKNGKILYNLTISYLDLKRRMTGVYARRLGRIKGWRGRSEYILGTIDFEKDRWLTAKRHLLLFVRNPETTGTTLHSKRLGDAYCMLATCSRKLDEEPDKQFEFLKRALKYDPKSYKTLNDLGVNYAQIGESKIASQLFQKAVNMDPKHSHLDARLNLALSLNALDKNSEALRIIKKAIKMEPRESKALLVKAEILRTIGKYQLALDALNDALLFGKTHADVLPEGSIGVLQLKANIQNEIGDWAGLYETSRTISKLTKDVGIQKQSTCLMAMSLHKRKKHGQANKLLDQALKQYGTFHLALHSKYLIAMETRDFPTAVKFADLLLKDSPSIDHTFLKANALAASGKFGEALKFVNKTAKSNEIDMHSVKHSVEMMLNIAMGTRNKEHYKILESLCNRYIKKFMSRRGVLTRVKTIHMQEKIVFLKNYTREILLSCYQALNWLNAINGKEKEFQKLLLTTKKLNIQILKNLTSEEKKTVNDVYANNMYNCACGFAFAGNKTMAMKYLKIADKMNPDISYAKISKSDTDFLNIKK